MPNPAAEQIHVRDHDGLRLVTIDNPPVNAGSHAVREGLLTAISTAPAGTLGAVLIGAGKTFISGSDLREFGQPLAPPELPSVIRAIEEAPFPVVAALHGAALGGGLELALGCDARIAAPGTMLGLPEVTLGIIPGAGGTQRLPRLTGLPRAMEMIARGERIGAAEALRIGLIDAVATGDLATEAQALARSLAGQKRRVMDRRPPAAAAAETDATEAALTRRRGVRPNLTEALRMTRLADSADGDAALTEERRVFQELRLGPDAFALRHLFFAERAAGSLDGIPVPKDSGIATLGVVGGGTMGQGIARAALAAGLNLRLAERDSRTLQQAIERLQAGLQADHQKGRIDAATLADRLARAEGCDLAGLSGCDLVIEAIYEDMAAKTALLHDLAAILPQQALIATNTSYLDIDLMTREVPEPGRVLGLHFFSPADVMKLLEVVRTNETSDETLGRALAFARRLGKQPVVARVGEGFIGNRIYSAYRRIAELLLLEGASPEQIDGAMRDFGLAMGPFEVGDMSGLDIAWAMRKRRAASRPADERYTSIPDLLCEAGRLGRKSGGGWYDYPDGKAHPSEATAAIIAAERSREGTTPRDFSATEIQSILMAAILNEAACLMEDGIAARPGDIDVTLVHGYGFPRWRGGPVHWAAGQEPEALKAGMRELARLSGPTHREGDLRNLLPRASDEAL